MRLDSVHDTQMLYRELLQCMARPGRIASVRDLADKAAGTADCHPGTLLLMLTLLDSEVTFHIAGDRDDGFRQKIAGYTASRPSPAEEADFIIVREGTDEDAVLGAMERCKNGTLEDPQMSATWIIEEEGCALDTDVILTGPGIRNMEELPFRMSGALLRARNEKTAEYPLGVDLIFITREAELFCIPRTTVIRRKEEAAWVM